MPAATLPGALFDYDDDTGELILSDVAAGITRELASDEGAA